MSITSHDVARFAGVSQATVSRALRGDPRVSVATRERVRHAADALNYVPSAAGRSLSTHTTRRIGVLVSDLANPFYPYLVGPLHDELEQRGYRMMLLTERSDEALAAEQLLDHSIDGAVLTTATSGSGLPDALRRKQVPFVFLNRVGGRDGDSAVVDNELGGRLVADELAALGHTRVALLGGVTATSTGREREQGFVAGLADAGIALPASRIRRGPYDFDTGYHGLPELLAADPDLTAVFCGNDVVAIGAYNAALRAGLRIPEDLTLIGFDDLPMASWEAFALTTVRYDLPKMARAAARLLVERLTGDVRETARQVAFQPELVRRGTHAPPG
ncbi:MULTISPECIES: LacI family DNA-binding transcriptional regulator [unclassified Saccharopolyspora]|uniref:LacI family DNA-binding transcriptional regulator n=1 Tax=unclassified Saccharopolyspora TaxID=2646250 RepID=UPI001CD641CD|nr:MULTISPECIES: LacI family DNA-binding transcriptional regulator [unclassified Saccharopolyspora]MCA1185118.1 LacI family transcriptional regulator [Saccharopolyspora sp. 6T]MCA1191406.1 LacI family transcriptional regulator [Saccharopolyspora sp. 6V]MCA1224993.1 LacI family transcriptional regulator [Saccharopolyspora sp. 6M]MCA1278516.1 LacI family transcriptional regulator [Saccharopolyspora sp. 7B]